MCLLGRRQACEAETVLGGAIYAGFRIEAVIRVYGACIVDEVNMCGTWKIIVAAK